MSVAKSVASSVARSVASSVAVSSAGGLFDPLALPSPAFIIPFTEGSGQIAHNAAGAYTSADPNIWYAPENMGKFGYGSGPTTATDRYADFASGDSAATRINIPTGQFWYCDRSMRLRQSVQVTISFYYKATTGSSTPFTFDTTSTAPESLTATDSWQRFEFTFTPAGTTEYFYLIGVAPGSDILLYGLVVEEAATASAYRRPEGHLRISNKASDVTWVAEGVSITSATRPGAIIRNDDVTVSAFTSHIAFQYLGSNPASELNIFSDVNTSNLWMRANTYTAAAGEQNVTFKNGLKLGPRGTDIADGDWHILSVRYDGSTLEMFVDGCLQKGVDQAGTYSSYTFTPFALVSVGNGLTGAIGKYAYMAWYDAAHSNADLHRMIGYINSVIAERGITRTINNYLVFEGDSLTYGGTYVPLLPYADRCIPNLTAGTRVGINGISGSTVATLELRAASVDACVGSHTLATNKVLSVMIGVNDLLATPGTPESFLANLKSYCADRRAAGWKVCVSTISPGISPTFNAKRVVANAEINNAANIGVYWDAVASWDSDATVGIDAAGSDTDYYPDGYHPNNTCHALIEPYITAAVNSLLI